MNLSLPLHARLAAIAGLLVLAAQHPIAAQTYTITELPPLPGDAYCSAFALNENGQAAGNSGSRAVIWTGEVPANIQTLAGAYYSAAFALNDSGQATGDVFPAAGNSRAFFWNDNAMQRIWPPAGEYIDEAYAMNNSGVVVGPGGSATAGYRWQGGVFQSLGVLPGDHTARPLAINVWGQIAGTSIGFNGRRPATWLFTSPQAVPVPSDGTGQGEAWGISDLGVVVGEYHTSTGTKPFLWSSSLGTQALPLPKGVATGFAWASNNAGTVIGDAGGQPVVWRKTASGAYEVVLVATKLTNATGWSNLSLYAINEAGQIAGGGSFNGAGRGFILNPGPELALILRTDTDRSGTTDFDTAADATAPGRPFYFWTNDDHDATGIEVKDGPADSADSFISTFGQTRDLEDCARLALKLTPELKTALDAGAALSLETRGAGTIHLFATPSSGAETRYLNDESFALSLVTNSATNLALSSETANDGATAWAHLESLITSDDWSNGRLRFLWEGVTPGACVLTLHLKQPDGTELTSDPVHISLRPVQDFFERVRATPKDGFPPPWETNGVTPPMSWAVVHPQAVTPFGEQNADLVWVHGWRLTEFERQNWGETMFKRLWHAGYHGRLHSFTWPTLSGDDSKLDGLLTFDQSEHRAWKSGAALESYLRALRAAHQSARLGVIAHSMGNITTGEAFRRGAPADIQIMMQAAVSAGCYDTRVGLDDSTLLANERKSPSPDLAGDLGYRGYLSAVRVPTVNFFNPVDFALQTGKLGISFNWFDHQKDKPYNPSGKGTYAYLNETSGLYSGKKLLREVTDIHESMALIARSRTKAVGAQAMTGFTVTGNPIGTFVDRINLQQTFSFSRDPDEHSAQFNRPIQRQLIPFYVRIRRTITNEAQ